MELSDVPLVKNLLCTQIQDHFPPILPILIYPHTATYNLIIIYNPLPFECTQRFDKTSLESQCDLVSTSTHHMEPGRVAQFFLTSYE